MNKLPLATASVTTLDSTLTTVVSYTLPDATQGSIDIELSGEKDLTPSNAYYYSNTYTVSCESGVATIQATGGSPVILDPVTCGATVTVDTSGTTFRVRITGPATATWNWVGKINGILHYRIPSGTLAYYDPGVASAQTPYQDFVYDGTNIIADADMEAIGTGSWGTQAPAVLSKEGAAHGGAQCLRATSVAGVGGAFQSVLNTSRRYRFSHWLRTDGTAQVSVGDGGATAGITSPVVPAVWTQYTKSNYKPTASTLIYYKAAAGGSYIEMDDVEGVRVPIVTQSDNLITGGIPLMQSGAAGIRPTYLNSTAAAAQGITGACWQLDGVGQYFDTQWIPVDDFSILAWYYFDTIAAGTKYIGGSSDGTNTAQFVRATNVLRMYAGPSGVALSAVAALTVGWHHIGCGRSGTTRMLWLDGVPATDANGGTLPVGKSIYWGTRNTNGSPDAAANSGYTGKLVFCNRLLTDSEVLSNYYSTFRS